MPTSHRKTLLNPAVITHLHSTQETERILVSRELHDELGGLLVAASMDAAWAEQHCDTPAEVRKKMERIRHTLSAAIHLKRQMIEQLRPSLLDNFGLFAALRSHVKRSCLEAGVRCTEKYPTEEPRFNADALTGLYRILQEILAVSLRQPSIQALEITVKIEGDALKIRIAHDAPGLPSDADEVAMAATKHRVRRLGGKVRSRPLEKGGKVLTAQVPFARSLEPLH
jgi:signal transduction histidine kinase